MSTTDKVKLPEPVFIFWSADGQHIRLWTKDRQRALRFAVDSGVEAQVYAPVERVTAAYEQGRLAGLEEAAKVCEGRESMDADACANAIRSLATKKD